MFDTMTMTKVVGAVCGSLLVYLLVAKVGTTLYTVGGEAHAEGELAQAYTIDTGAGEAPAAEDAAAAGPDFATVFAAADVAAGEKVFAKCKSCHKVDGTNATGPHLNGVVGRNHGSVEGFAYSDALVAMASVPWSPEEMDKFLTSPKAYAPGTKMSFAGLPKVEDRANVIAYLATLP